MFYIFNCTVFKHFERFADFTPLLGKETSKNDGRNKFIFYSTLKLWITRLAKSIHFSQTLRDGQLLIMLQFFVSNVSATKIRKAVFEYPPIKFYLD